MVDSIEKLQYEYTDKYVVVDDNIPELARFGGYVGQVKTINMNGRALVQFEAWNNIGWYDIEVDCLRVVPKPEPGEVAARKAAPAKEAPPAAAKAPAAKPATAGGAKQSTADILAAARAAKAGGAAPAAPKPAAAKPAGGKMSTADILAAARAKAAAAAEPVAGPATTTEAPEAEPAAATAAEPPVAKSATAAGGATLPSGRRPTVAEILVWCRANDAS